MEEQQATDDLKEIKLSEAKLQEAMTKEARMAEAKLMSISIAMFMAVVAMLGAVTAYRAALAEQETLRFERRLQQGEMLELVKRQELLSKVSSRTRYENSAALHSPSADGDQEQPGKLAALDKRQAALKTLQAEEEAAHVRSLRPYLNYFYVYLPYAMEPSIAMHSAIFLRALGFDTVWVRAGRRMAAFPTYGRNWKLTSPAGRLKSYVLPLPSCCLWWRSHFSPSRN